MGRRGVNVKIWTFLYLNTGHTFTAREISRHLDLPLSTAQLALRKLVAIAPRVFCVDLVGEGRGRPEKSYSYLRTFPVRDGGEGRVSRDV